MIRPVALDRSPLLPSALTCIHSAAAAAAVAAPADLANGVLHCVAQRPDLYLISSVD